VGRRNQSTSIFEDLINITALMPWWVGVMLSIISYAVLHYFATAEVAGPATIGQMGAWTVKQLYKTLAMFGQYILPTGFLTGSVMSAIKRRQRETLISSAARGESASVLSNMTWREFETLVGEAFRLKGFSVAETGGGGSDGGVDLVLKKGTETFLVQCKQWRAFKVSVNTVRELYGVMAARGAAGGYVVTSGRFTDDAKEFASGRNIELIEGKALHDMIQAAKSAEVSQKNPSPRQVSSAASGAAPTCPKCGTAMVKRTAKQGAHIGSEFWGCPRYPACRGTRPV
jgi:restriction system protein